jgi:transcription initiation factor IIE alpha subunit
MLICQQVNNLTDEEVANKISLSLAETKDILFGWIEKFTLDRLVEYAGKLLTSSQVEIVVKHTDNQPKEHARTT